MLSSWNKVIIIIIIITEHRVPTNFIESVH